MKLKNYWKRFWTLDRHHAAGFTLVELIVVIAILAILAGVGIPVYSGYITKANKQADMTLVNEVKKALELGYYSGKLKDGGLVVLSLTGASGTGVDESMTAAFGDGWDTEGNTSMSLKHDGWSGVYQASSFKGDEAWLLGHVEDLTEVLGGFLTDHKEVLAPDGRFSTYLTGTLGFSPDDMENSGKVADAAVLYVADATQKLTDEKKAQFQTIAKNAATASDGDIVSYMINEYTALYDNNLIMGTAAAYAMLVSYCEYEDNKADNSDMVTALGKPDASGVNEGDLEEMTKMLEASFMNLGAALNEKYTVVDENGNPVVDEDGNEVVDMTSFLNYWENVAATDAAAYIDALGKASTMKNQVIPNLGAVAEGENPGCYDRDEFQALFDAYAEGSIFVEAVILADGTLSVTTTLDDQ